MALGKKKVIKEVEEKPVVKKVAKHSAKSLLEKVVSEMRDFSKANGGVFKDFLSEVDKDMEGL
jgi:effector-binding domain-containing protein